jgi:hypothetical protein
MQELYRSLTIIGADSFGNGASGEEYQRNATPRMGTTSHKVEVP